MASPAVAAAFAAACGSGSAPPPNPVCDAGGVSCMAFDSGPEASTSSSGSSSGSSSSSGGTEAGSEAGEADSGEGGTTPGEAGADGGCTMFEYEGNAGGTITVSNFDNGCTVSLNGAATSVSSTYQACLPLGNAAQIVVGPASAMFEVGPTPFVRIWGGEVPDGSIMGMGDGGSGSTSRVQVGISSSAACVLVCCPFTDGTGCDSSFSGYSAFLQNCP